MAGRLIAELPDASMGARRGGFAARRHLTHEVAERGVLGRIAQQHAEEGMKAVVAQLGAGLLSTSAG